MKNDIKEETNQQMLSVEKMGLKSNALRISVGEMDQKGLLFEDDDRRTSFKAFPWNRKKFSDLIYSLELLLRFGSSQNEEPVRLEDIRLLSSNLIRTGLVISNVYEKSYTVSKSFLSGKDSSFGRNDNARELRLK